MASANVAEAVREVKWGAVAIIPKVTGKILNVDQRGKPTLPKQYWVLDSGATHNMTSEKSYFRTIEEMDTNVQLLVTILPPNVDLYLFEHTKNTSDVYAYGGVGQQTIELWHSRLGHLGYQNIAKFIKQRSTTGIQISDRQLSDFPVWDECVKVNQQRAPFKNTNTEHAKQVNGLVFTDLKGAIEVDSLGRKRFVHLIVDDWSGYITVDLLRHKSEALQRFQEYVAHTENKHGRGIIVVNSDNEGQFISPAWIAYCNKKGIIRRATTPRTPEQNGSAEVRFRVLFRKVRSMLIAAQLLKQFWGEAIHAAVYAANCSPLQ
ncbi:Integrase, catalytic core protein [Phytophthora megakarya]|uniref:Integrase, catalytic core protein n=1 Tax=Phytophthora megakarya TaxID=4795 RepID=A0A225W7J8_9STRA|nr:Integrase, catalytic core protein [Phytophthora megakarya]